MEKSDALAYIARFIENTSMLSVDATKYELRGFFEQELGDKLFESSTKKVLGLARRLYAAYVLSIYTRYTAYHIAKAGLTLDEMKDMLKAQIALDKKYKIYYGSVDTDLSESKIDKMIKKQGMTKYKPVINKMVPELSPSAIKKEEARERAEAREAKKAEREAKAKAKGKKSPVKKTTTKKTTAKKSTTKKTIKKTSGKTKKTCKEYKVVDLKEMAKEKGHTGYSKLKKDELCKLLKIK